MKYATIGLLAGALLAGCAPQQPAPAPAPYVPAALVTPAPASIQVPPSPLLALDPEVRKAFISGRTAPLHNGLTTTFRYNSNAPITINCAAGRLTEIDLGPEDNIVSNDLTGISNSTEWQMIPHGNHLLIEPKDANSPPSDLVLITDTHSYHLWIRVHPPHMAIVNFWYPDTIRAAFTRWEAAKYKAAKQQEADAIASKPLDFAYRIDGPHYAWRPLQVMDDGEHTYIELPDNLQGTDQPVLYAEDQNGDNSVINYQIRQNLLVADRLLQHAALSVGTGSNREVVRITKQ